MDNNMIPLIAIEEDSIPLAYEAALTRVWNEGARLKTEYDKQGAPESRDATVCICVRNPFAQPRFHRSFADSLGALGEYVMEVVYGAHDYWVKSKNEILKAQKSEDTRWTYTYHERLNSYSIEGKIVDQISYIIDKLSKVPYSRRAQAITWNVGLDPATDDPPCLQRIWGRLTANQDGSYAFNMNTHWRSRDLFKAWFENVIAITTLQKKIAEAISANINKPVFVGRYVDISDSMHIYGSYFREIEGDPDKGVKNFFDMLKTKSIEDRTWTSEFVKPFFVDDGIGKGIAVMLEREKDSMPKEVLNKIKKELELLNQDDYVV